MRATINITTPAGKSLEGFPLEALEVCRSDFFLGDDNTANVICDDKQIDISIKVHKGDTITIKIEE